MVGDQGAVGVPLGHPNLHFLRLPEFYRRWTCEGGQALEVLRAGFDMLTYTWHVRGGGYGADGAWRVGDRDETKPLRQGLFVKDIIFHCHLSEKFRNP